MAFGFKKPIFLHQDFILGDHLSIASIPYSLETFENDLKKLQEVSMIEGRQEKINSSSLFQTSTYFENI